jgi:hypothetical protein
VHNSAQCAAMVKDSVGATWSPKSNVIPSKYSNTLRGRCSLGLGARAGKTLPPTTTCPGNKIIIIIIMETNFLRDEDCR